MIEVLIRGAGTDYLGFRHLPTFDSGSYNLPDLEIEVGLALGLVAAVLFLLRKRHTSLLAGSPSEVGER
jgi:hypothetical protein